MDCPRLVVAGTGGDAGKTLVSLGLVRAWRSRGLSVGAFKKGPDFIDAAWLGLAAGGEGRNLDAFLMGAEGVRRAFFERAPRGGASLVEGNRGLYDGAGPEGTWSTAELAKLLGAPVVLVLPVTKTTRTAAATALGCRLLDPEVEVCGVILNRVAGGRHERVVREAVERYAGLPVLGAIPRLPESAPLILNRHLGLVTPAEHAAAERSIAFLEETVEKHVDVERLLEAARRTASPAAFRPLAADSPAGRPASGRVRVGVLRDGAFSFYYPENLEALERSGAELVFASPLSDEALPAGLDALYIGGGFPETHGSLLSENRSFAASMRASAAAGLPIYAECGGLVYLSRALHWEGAVYPMSGVLPVEVRMHARPRGHGYVEAVCDGANPFFAEGTAASGHEFHYSALTDEELPAGVSTAFAVRRGTGCVPGRDGLVSGSVLATYFHLHALGTPEWAAGLLGAARAFRSAKSEPRAASAAGLAAAVSP